MKRSILALLVLLHGVSATFAAGGPDWWDKAWTGRKPLTLDTTAEGGAIKDAVGNSIVLVRLHQGNFPFEAAQEGGTDLRFVAADGKTVLPYHVEKWDSLMLEGIVWVQVPDIAADGKTEVMLYYGNPEPDAESGADLAKTYPEEFALVYHFAERGAPPKDATKNANNASAAGTISEGALIASGMRLLGADPIEIPGSPTLEWKDGGEWTWSAWVKAGAATDNAVILSRAAGNSAFRVGLDKGIPFVQVVSSGAASRTAPGDPIVETNWNRLDVVAKVGEVVLFVNGKEYAKLAVSLPAMTSGFFLGGDQAGSGGSFNRFVGEIDEMQMLTVARGPGSVAFGHLNQSGSEASNKLLVPGEDEGSHGGGHNHTLEHIMLFGDIANNMMFDGWIAVGVCVVMIIFGWTVAVKKWVLLGRIEKGDAEFQSLWREVSHDLTALDLDDPESMKTFGGKLGKKAKKLLKDSPLYHVYHVGSDEIRHRLGGGKNKGQGLSARSIQAIRASLDAALVHEKHRLDKGIVFLTISIAGGPYVGLLGTVVGVMITFAIIAKSGEVDVNSIAPGIASALLATTVGLVVAIPALFAYSFLANRIKGIIGEMQVFIDEFVAKIAEFYPPPGEAALAVPIRQIRTPEAAIRQEESSIDDEVQEEIRK
ncbi:MAG: DUF2341 domain-containing protein [Terrimicrobiaceae bacterium]